MTSSRQVLVAEFTSKGITALSRNLAAVIVPADCSFEPESLKEIKRLQDEKCPDAEWVGLWCETAEH